MSLAKQYAEQIGDVQSVSVQQSSAMEQVAVGIDQVATVVQQNSTAAEELASIGVKINGQANVLNGLVVSLKEDISTRALLGA